MIKIDWFKLLKNHIWFGWLYYGSRSEGNPMARDNWIYWCYYPERNFGRRVRPWYSRTKQ